MIKEFIMNIEDYGDSDTVGIYEYYRDEEELGRLIDVLDRDSAILKYRIVGEIVNGQVSLYEDDTDGIEYDASSPYDSDD